MKSQQVSAQVKPGIRKQAAPAKKIQAQAPVSMSAPSWPQAMSAGGSATGHIAGGFTPRGLSPQPQRAVPAVAVVQPEQRSEPATALVTLAGPVARGGMAAPLFASWTKAAEQVFRPLNAQSAVAGFPGANPMKAALEGQVQLYRSMLRYSPLSLAVQSAARGQSMLMSMMQVLLPKSSGEPTGTNTRQR